jgi:hypothetical protein
MQNSRELYKKYTIYYNNTRTLGLYDKENTLYVLTNYSEHFDEKILDELDPLHVTKEGVSVGRVRHPKKVVIKYINEIVPNLETRLNIQTLSYDKRGLDFALLNYIQNNCKDNNNVIIGYFLGVGKDILIDKTNRSWVDIWQQGYRGNRLDVMIGEYECIIKSQYHYLTLGIRRAGAYKPLSPYEPTVSELISEVYNDRFFNRTYLMRKE